jgi:hypothetical protein
MSDISASSEVKRNLRKALAYGLWIYLTPNITVRPREYPRFTGQESKSQALNVLTQESAKVAA